MQAVVWALELPKYIISLIDIIFEEYKIKMYHAESQITENAYKYMYVTE